MTPLGPDDLVLTASALGFPPFGILVEAAAAGGFAGVSLWPAETYGAALDAGLRVDELRSMLDDHGVVVADCEAIVVWAGANDPGAPYLRASPAEMVYEAANVLGAPTVNSVVIGDRDVAFDEVVEAVATVCDDAAAHGVTVGFEFARASALRTLTDALAVRDRLPDRDVGITVDSWQLHWGPATLDSLADAPSAAIRCVQIDDAPPQRPPDLLPRHV